MKRDARLHVFFLVPELAACGEAAQARVLATALPAGQFRVTVGLLGLACGDDLAELEAEGIAVKSAPIRHALDVAGARRLRRAVRECAPDVVHAWGAAAARFARLFVGRDANVGNTPRLVISHAAVTGGGVRGWLAARQMRRADRITPSTRADGERYRRLGVPAEQLTLIAPAAPVPPRAADRDAFFAELNIPPGARLVVTGGRSEAGVGPKDAIVAFDMLRYDMKDLHLAITGAANETKSLERFGRALAFDDFRLRFGPCTPIGADAVCFADAVFATSPLGGVEDALGAMSVGKPVVGWKTPDLAEIVDDKVTGLLVPVGDRAALATSMRVVLDNPAYARRLGEAGRARAAERFGLARMVEQFVRLYQELAPENGRA